ncbi:MAG: VOC family protein [Candidatus Heimdallarchaeota archaeon]|nr:VOC family protein [Candidatus Heimdallarchaeota archaeon]
MKKAGTPSVESHIVGIGGIFFKSRNPDELTEWYKSALGFSVQVPYTKDDTAISFKWKTFEGENQNTLWAPFKEDTTYFSPSHKNFMINYIVKDIIGLMLKLEKKGIKPIDSIKEYPYGKFVSIVDIEGNKIEFWEPNKYYFKNKY